MRCFCDNFVQKGIAMKEKNIAEKFGENVRKFRNLQGITQEDLAEKSELHRTYIGMVERGERNISLNNAYRIATALNVSLSEMMEGIK